MPRAPSQDTLDTSHHVCIVISCHIPVSWNETKVKALVKYSEDTRFPETCIQLVCFQ